MISYKYCNDTDIYGSYKNLIHIMPCVYVSKFNKTIISTSINFMGTLVKTIIYYDTIVYYNDSRYYIRWINLESNKCTYVLRSEEMHPIIYKAKSVFNMEEEIKNIIIKEENEIRINILFTNLADNTKKPGLINDLEVRKQYLNDFNEERLFIQKVINSNKYDIIILEELYTDIIFDNIEIDSIRKDIDMKNYDIIVDAAMRGKKKYYYDTFYKNFSTMYNKNLTLNTNYMNNVRSSRIVCNTIKKDLPKNINNITNNELEEMISPKEVELKVINKEDLINKRFFRLSYTNITNNDHNMQHNIFNVNYDNNDLSILVCNIHMVNAYRDNCKDKWINELELILDSIDVICVDFILLCGDFNACGSKMMYNIAIKHGYYLVGSIDNKQSRSHMYNLYKSNNKNYIMHLEKYKIKNPIHDKSGNHPVIQLEMSIKKNTIININNVRYYMTAKCKDFV